MIARMAALETSGGSSSEGASGLVMERAGGDLPLAVPAPAANPQGKRYAPACGDRRNRFPGGRPKLYTKQSKQGDKLMAMTMTGEVQLPASREAVWAKLNDPAVLRACIPGCEQLEMTSDTEFQAIATIKVGPVKARWKGKVRLTDLDPPNSYRISGEGEGGVAGFAKGGAKVALAEHAGGTLLTYDVEAQIGGKLAQLGQRLIAGAAKKTADDFFQKFATAVGGSSSQ
jgi:hypothetical protein